MKKIKIFLMLFSMVAFCNVKPAEKMLSGLKPSLEYLKNSASDLFNKITLDKILSLVKNSSVDGKLGATGTAASVILAMIITNTVISLNNDLSNKSEYIKLHQDWCGCHDLYNYGGQHVSIYCQTLHDIIMNLKKEYYLGMIPAFIFGLTSYKLLRCDTLKGLNKTFGNIGIVSALAVLYFILRGIKNSENLYKYSSLNKEEKKILASGLRKEYLIFGCLPTILMALNSYRLLKHS